MRRVVAAAAAAGVLTGAGTVTGTGAGAMPAASQAAPVLAPEGKWLVDYGEDGCLLARSYGTGKDQVVIGWRSLPLADTMQMVVQQRGSDQTLRRGAVTVTLSPGTSDEMPYDGFPSGGAGQRRIQAWVRTAQFANLPARVNLTIAASRQKPVTVALSGAQRAFAALATCNDATLKRWGIDPAERDAIATPPQGEPARWISANDYPLSAVQRGAIGSTTLLYTVAADGRVTECRAVIHSGTEELDDAGCDALRRRARFVPATGRDGKPVAAHMTSNIRWMVPGAWQEDPAYRALMARDRRERQEGAAGGAR